MMDKPSKVDRKLARDYAEKLEARLRELTNIGRVKNEPRQGHQIGKGKAQA